MSLLPEIERELLRVARLALPDDGPARAAANGPPAQHLSRRLRPRPSGLVAAAVIVFALAIGAVFVSGLRTGTAGTGNGGRGSTANQLFPGAPRSQNDYGDNWPSTDDCPRAAPNRYLPAWSGCVTALRVDLAGDGTDLVLVYSRLSHARNGMLGPPAMYEATGAFLRVIRPGGGRATVRIGGFAYAAELIAVSHVNDAPGEELFIETSRISSGATVVVYSFYDGKIIAGPTLGYGGDSAQKAGFECLSGSPPRLLKRTFQLNGPTIHNRWTETEVTYAWHGPRLVEVAKSSFAIRGWPQRSQIIVGAGCRTGVAGTANNGSTKQATAAFPGAPHSQPNGYGVYTGVCPLAAPNRYLPPRSGCVSVTRVALAGTSWPGLVILYSRLSHERATQIGFPKSMNRLYVASMAFLEVVQPGRKVVTRINGAKATWIDAVAHINDESGKELFIEVERDCCDVTYVVYGFSVGRLVPAGVSLTTGGDGADRAGFNCLAGNPPRVVQRIWELIGPTIYGWWRESEVTYAWHGLRLVQISKRTFRRHGLPPAGSGEIGARCSKGIGQS